MIVNPNLGPIISGSFDEFKAALETRGEALVLLTVVGGYLYGITSGAANEGVMLSTVMTIPPSATPDFIDNDWPLNQYIANQNDQGNLINIRNSVVFNGQLILHIDIIPD